MLTSVGCFDPVEVPNAYDTERYLCGADQAEAFAQRVKQCRARRDAESDPCAGVFSFRGMLQGVDIVVDSDLEEVIVDDVRLTQSDTIVRDAVRMMGRSPYFLFDLTAKLLGGDVDLPEADRTLRIAPSVDPDSTWYEDDRTDVELNVTAGATRDIQLATGTLEIDVQTEEENVGRFRGESAAGDTVIEGCFHAFTTELRLERDML